MDLTPVELVSRIGWMMSLHRELTNVLRERVVQWVMAHHSNEQILAELAYLLELLATELQ